MGLLVVACDAYAVAARPRAPASACVLSHEHPHTPVGAAGAQALAILAQEQRHCVSGDRRECDVDRARSGRRAPSAHGTASLPSQLAHHGRTGADGIERRERVPLGWNVVSGRREDASHYGSQRMGSPQVGRPNGGRLVDESAAREPGAEGVGMVEQVDRPSPRLQLGIDEREGQPAALAGGRVDAECAGYEVQSRVGRLATVIRRREAVG